MADKGLHLIRAMVRISGEALAAAERLFEKRQRDEVNIVAVSLSREAPLMMQGADLAAYRFVTDDGRVAIVPFTRELLDDASVDTEEMARELAVPELAKLVAQDG